MPPSTTTMFRAARSAGFRTANTTFRFTGRRFQSTSSSSSTSSAEAQIKQSWFKRMWDSPVGVKTVHFWAPVMKWALVLAGISDFARPAEKLSLTQNGALTATGLIWTRWCFVIRPQNHLLAAVNFFLAGVGITQLSRIALYHQSLKALPPQAEKEAAEAKAELDAAAAAVKKV
jgi:hypothetical protein